MIDPQTAVDLSQIAYWKEIEDQRVKDAQKIYSWYYNDKDDIVLSIRQAMLKIFRSKTLDRMSIRVFNIVPRVVDKLCLVYKVPAERLLDGGTQYKVTEGKNVAIPNPANDAFQEVLTKSSINKKSREWHKLGKLFNTILVQPIWKEEKQAVDFTVHTPAWTVVVPDASDYLRASAFYYPITKSIGNLPNQQVLVYWSKDEYFYVDTLGNKIADPDYPDMRNPYGVLPVAVLRFKEGNDFWGEGLWDLVDGNEEVCVQTTNMCYTSILQSHGQPVAINMGLTGEPEIGPDKPMCVDEEQGSNGKTAPSFGFANANPHTKEVQDLIDWFMKTMQSIKGLSPQQYSLEASVASGVSKVADSIDMSEMREDDTHPLEEMEYELFPIIRTVYNYHSTGKKISDTAKFSIAFGDVEIKKTAQDKVAERTFGMASKTMSRLEMVMEDHPGMSKEDAQKYLEQIQSEDEMFNPDAQLIKAFSNTNDTTPQPPSKA